MYINKVTIENIRSISRFEMQFPENSAGWHVLIGDNGSGKSSIIRSIAIGLIGPEQVYGIRPNWNDWLRQGAAEGKIGLWVSGEIDSDIPRFPAFPLSIKFTASSHGVYEDFEKINREDLRLAWRKGDWFSAGFGPFRRFTGGTKEYESIFESPSLSRLSSHLSLFSEEVALTEITAWLKDLQFQFMEGDRSAHNIINHITALINSPDFLPQGVQLIDVGWDGAFFRDGNGVEINVNQMSDGFRSILSLTFELIRQLVKVFGERRVFAAIKRGNMFIDLPGVVLIDEVDAHLHPTWQTRIGQWFLKYFPNIQFIVTTHSPLVCRACEKGSIWRLSAPGSDQQSGEVTGVERSRLIFGNVLDAYGTEVFGENVSISQEANEKLNELAELNVKSMMGEISLEEKAKLQELKTILPTDNSYQK